LRFLGL